LVEAMKSLMLKLTRSPDSAEFDTPLCNWLD
jgi:hypothetical protein